MKHFHRPSRTAPSSAASKSLYTLLAFSAAVLLQPASAKESACQRWGGSVALSNGKLYYTGGWYRSSKAKDAATVAKSLLTIDLSNSWAWDAIGVSEVDSVPELYSDKEAEPIPILIGSNNTIYSIFAASEDKPGYSISSTASKPKAVTLKLKTSDFTTLKNSVYTQSSTTATAYAVGEGENGVIVASFDMQNSTVSTPKPAKEQTDLSLPAKGILEYLPVGTQGALVYFGGMVGKNKASLDRIKIFDLSDFVWREQQTTGNDPSNAGGDIVCSAYAQAKDGSSHSIYAFKNDGSVFILSLPAFIWIQIPPQSSSAPDFEPPRESDNTMASCMVAPGSRQVIFFGAGSKNKDTCDKGKGVYVYDLNDLAWKDAYDEGLVGFEVPSHVSRTIGGDASGGANMAEPERGWSTTGLRRLFMRVGDNSNTGNEDDTSGSDGKSNSDSKDNSTPVPGTNADPGTGNSGGEGGGNGGKISGAVAAVLIIGALVGAFLYMRYRRSQRGQSTLLRSIMSPPEPPHGQSKHAEAQFEYDDDYDLRRRRNSVIKFDSVQSFSAGPLSTRWSPAMDPFRSPVSQDTKDLFSPATPISRKPTEASSTLYTPSALLAQAPDTSYSQPFPRSPQKQRFNGTDSDSITHHPDYVFELPAHLPAKAYTQSRRGSPVMQLGELEGDYMHPVEMGESDIPDTAPTMGKKIARTQRNSQEMLLNRECPGVGRPESAVLPANVRSALGYTASVKAKPGIDRSATDDIVFGKARLERNPSIQGRRQSAQAPESEKKAWTGKAKLVELKRGPSLRKKEGVNFPDSPSTEGAENRQLNKLAEE
ncbi:hypothetical protein EV426DRAFT_718365 [Tirmania nivea]|nr:hypothetical protein EV426DRAFT_718365 [Tirmania nivea]